MVGCPHATVKVSEEVLDRSAITDQEILDIILGVKNDADAKTGDFAREEDDGSASYESKAEESDASEVS